MPLENNTEIPQNLQSNRAERHVTALLSVAAVVLVSLVAFVFSKESTVQSPVRVLSAAAVSPYIFSDVHILASAAIVFDITSGELLYEKNAHTRLPLASLTKVPLAFVVAESISPEQTILTDTALPPLQSANGIAPGTRMTIQDLIDYTLAPSSNEGAEMLARFADSAIRARFPDAPEGLATLWRMNDLARRRNVQNTFFGNTTGLDVDNSTAGAYGSAEDVARLFGYIAEKQPDTFARTTKPSFVLGDALVGNTNEVLGAIPGFVLGKTGFTDLAGGNLAIIFEPILGRRIAIVVLGSTKEGRFEDTRTLITRTREYLRL